MNFLFGLRQMNFAEVRFYFLVAKDSSPHRYLEKISEYVYYVAPRNPLRRLFFEYFTISKTLKADKIDIIYTYFGFGFFSNSIPQISGSADSNIYYPEVNFWDGYNKIEKLKKYIIDKYRIWGIKHAQAIVFENEVLLRRAQSIYEIKNAIFIKPSIVIDYQSTPFSLPKSVPASAFKALFLCGWHLNKNIMLIPEIAAELKKSSKHFHFLLSAPVDGSALHLAFEKKLKIYNVVEMVTIIGQVNKNALSSLYAQIDFVMLLSKLESFSNNIIEAWQFRKPLVISSEDWATSICKEAAFYVERESAVKISELLAFLTGRPDLIDEVVRNGIIELSNYPTINQRIQTEVEYLKNELKNS